MLTPRAEDYARQIIPSNSQDGTLLSAPRLRLYCAPIFMEIGNTHQSQIIVDTGEPSVSAWEINLRRYSQQIDLPGRYPVEGDNAIFGCKESYS